MKENLALLGDFESKEVILHQGNVELMLVAASRHSVMWDEIQGVLRIGPFSACLYPKVCKIF